MLRRVLPIMLILPLLLVARLSAQTLEITWIDVEGGAATLMVTPAGETVLVDTGSPGRRDPERIFKAVAAAGKRRIDHLVITHYHSDHFGGAAELSELLPIGTVYDNAEFDGMPEKPPKTYREFKCEKRVQINPGDKLPLKRGPQDESTAFEIICLGTRQTFIAPPTKGPANGKLCEASVPKERDGSDNANSVVLLVKFGEFRFFDAGDLTWNQEAKLVCPTNLIGKVDVYQTTHHGLDASNNPLVIKSIEPRVAIMNNGATKGCMPEVFANLQEQKTIQAIYQLHKNLRPDGEQSNTVAELIANTDKECNGNTIQLSVAADAKSYSVSIPATKHTRKFETTSK
jgi:beta-lactamase superfamily II metal-dependent hydrolase